MMYKLLLTLLLITFSQLSAFNFIDVNDGIGSVNLAPKAEVFFDSTSSKYKYEDVSAKSFTHNFMPISSKSVSSGYTSDIIWVRFSLNNNMDKVFRGSLEIPVPWVNKVDMYINTDGVLSVQKLGASFAHTQKQIEARTFFIPLSINANKTATIYIKVQGTNSLTLSPHLYSRKASTQRITNTAIFTGAIIGAILLMFLYNFNMYITLRESNYLYYILYLLGVLFFIGTYYGFNYQLLWKNSPNFNEAISPFIISFSFFSALLFSLNFLKLEINFPKIDKILSVFMYLLFLFAIVSPFMDDRLMVVYISILFIVLTLISLIFISIISINKKVSGSSYVLAAWIISSLTLSLSSAMLQGYLEYSHIIYEMFGFGTMLNIMFLAFALVSRTKDIREQNISTIGEEEKTIHDLNRLKAELTDVKEKLERKVDIQNTQIREKTNEIKKFSIKDELTSLYNKDKLEELLLNELHRTKRYYDDFSIIVVNIDGLQKINEAHSYEVGNSVIKEMADIISNAIRYIDTVGRWSDSEFLIICPKTSSKNAVIAAEHLINSIKENKFFFIGNGGVSASFGVTSALAKDTEQDMIQRAYKALYMAKENGKNRVEVF